MTDATLAGTGTGAGPAAPGVSGRLARLAAARVAAQALGFLWFIYAARTLPATELGLLSSGLALVVVLGGLCDLGTTRTVVRHVAARPGSLRANLVRALQLRIGAGLVIGLLVTGLLPLVTDLPAAAVALAGWIAAASGGTEVDFAALRSIGRTRAEVGILVLERSTFTVLAIVALTLGAGPLLILGLYGATNTLSTVLGAVACLRVGGDHEAAGPFFDPEGRRTAVSSTLLIVAPRASIVVLVLLGSPAGVAAFAVAQKPTEALSLLVLALAAPALPILRAKAVAGSAQAAGVVAGRVAAAGLAVSGATLGWLAADPSAGLSLLVGAGRDLGGDVALRLLAVAAALAVVRGALELLLLAHERAAALVRATAAALAVTVVVGVALVERLGATGAGWAALAGECTALVVILVGALRAAPSRVLLGPLVTSTALAAAVAGVVTVADPTPLGGLVVAGVASVIGLVLAGHHVRALERAAS